MKNFLKILRKKLKLTQAEFGKKLGVSRDVICNIEYGRVEPKDIFIDHVCKIFEVNKDWLTTGNGNIFSDNANSDLLNEAIELFSNLDKKYQKYILKQMKELLALQNQDT